MKKSLIALCLLTYAVGFSQDWTTSFAAAKRKAAAENKTIFLLFSGPDWCDTCTRLDELVFSSETFKAVASKKWVLLRADFAEKKGMPEPFDVNDEKVILAEKYNRDGFFPFVVLLDKTGKKLGKTGYENLPTADEYVAQYVSMGR
ncbi:thioredoxin family protein [Flavobacterium sp. RHBU_24]|uniref:thioredoxin family protein n=1 Tax=Flavobacterium sp. RHBU_24 TaxID=3391185 RepID=UPI003984634F